MVSILKIFILIFSTFILFPIILFGCLLVLIFDMHFPIFVQERAGINGKKIVIYKIKSMKYFYNNQLKVTLIGAVLRLTKIDELPQIFNIIKGDMNFIGPRPLFTDFNKFYKGEHKLRLSIKPGLTGLAQVELQDSADWKSKFDLDVYYYKNQSIILDLKIIYLTLIKLFRVLFLKKDKPIESLDYKKDFFENYVNK